ncbi:hypothetical protein Q31b_49950 [Novipirellula aureliae]|uniref:HAMP domain-containing protein n=1 Tax=Novipirellula aureliae TaxID=2527966 RepID=A0A5C6DHA4_9BACT|nr:hypothetical protein [Novipirellula aureliae]TWU36713.1 hypothetical protein Q31b_49950 [Novipirellula aureliae]
MNWKSLPSLSTRKYLIADPYVQGAILRRVALYAMAAFAYYVVVIFFSVYISDNQTPPSERLLTFIDDAITWLPGLLVLGPIAAYDLLTMTNRFAGPICRLRREMRLLIDNQSASELHFREHDHWSDVAEVYNELRKEVIDLRQEVANRHSEPPTS